MTVRPVCPYGDPLCPCPDGLLCHYEGPDAYPPPEGYEPPPPESTTENVT